MANSPQFDFIKAKMEAVPPQPFEARYDAGTPGGSGFRRYWPHILGWSPKPTDLTVMEEIVLCFQYHPPAHRDWRCMKLAALKDWGDVPGPAPTPTPDVTPAQLTRQNCVNVVAAVR